LSGLGGSSGFVRVPVGAERSVKSENREDDDDQKNQRADGRGAEQLASNDFTLLLQIRTARKGRADQAAILAPAFWNASAQVTQSNGSPSVRGYGQ